MEIKSDIIEFIYQNYKGSVDRRRVQNARLVIGDSEYHGEHVLLLIGFDLDKMATREFLVSDIQKWL